jgi:hypothetical protein
MFGVSVSIKHAINQMDGQYGNMSGECRTRGKQ